MITIRRHVARAACLAPLTVLFGVLLAHAEEPAIRLSLADAIAKGVATSHRLGELAARREASEAAVDGTRAGLLPQVSTQGGYTRTSHVDEFGLPIPGGGFRIIYPDEPNNWRSRLDMQWPIYTGGRIDALTRAARADAQAAGSDIDAARTDLRLDIARAYWNLVTAREAVAVVAESVRRVEAHVADARARFDTGFVPPNEVSSAEAQRSLQQALLIESQNTARVANLTLARLVGLPPTASIDPSEPPGSAPTVPVDQAALVEEARRTREDRRALVTRLAAATERRTAAATTARPAVVVSGGVDYARPNPRIFPRVSEWHESWDVSLNASWLLFDGGRVRADVAGADALERALQKRLDEYDSLLEVEVRQRWFDVDSSRASVRAAEDAVRSAAEARRVLQDRYETGVATSTEVLDAQVVLLEAELQRTRALTAVRVAEASLERAVGR